MTFARVENDPDHDSAMPGIIERGEHNRVREGIGREIDRMFRAAD